MIRASFEHTDSQSMITPFMRHLVNVYIEITDYQQ